MSETTELIAQQILNGNINKRTWGDILYNVKVYGAKGDWNTVTSTGTDDTAAIQATIDYAMSVGGKAVFFPHGVYKVTALTNVTSVVLFGDNATFSGISDTINQIGKPPTPPVSLVYNVKDYGAKGDGITDDTASINNALLALKTAGGGILYFPSGVYLVSAQIKLRQGNSISVVARGAGKWSTVIRRKSTYAAGDIFLIDGADGGGCSTLIEEMRIENAPAMNNTSGNAIHVKNTNTVSLSSVHIEDGYTGIYLENSNTISINDCTYFNTAAYSALGYTALAGILTSGAINTVTISNSHFVGQGAVNAANVSAGAYIKGSDGIQFNNCAFSGKIGVLIEGGNGANIGDVYFSNCIMDGCSTNGIKTIGTNAPNVFCNIRFDSCHINTGNYAGGGDVVAIDGDVDFIEFIGGNVNLGVNSGINIISSASYLGGTKKSIIISDMDISENNLGNTSGKNGINILNNVSGVTIKGCKIRNRSASGHQQYAVSIGTGCANLIIIGNDFYGNGVGALAIASAPTSSIIKDNLGVDDLTGVTASATSITLPVNRIIPITGTTTINTILGGWQGRTIQIFPNDGSLILGTTGNILRGVTLAQFQMVNLTLVGNNWVIG